MPFSNETLCSTAGWSKHIQRWTPAGRSERSNLIEKRWPGILDNLRRELKGNAYNLADLCGAFALGSPQARDEKQLPMRIVV